MIIKNKLSPINKKNKINLTIGAYDALHTGHLKVLNTLTEKSGNDGAKSCIITFNNRPRHVIIAKNDGIIFSNADRTSLFKESGIDYLFYLKFTKRFASVKADDFIKRLTSLFNINRIIVGGDFKFGRNNEGNIRALKKFQKEFDFKLTVLTSKKSAGKKISTTLIKNFIKKGNIQMVNKLLGREYFLSGKVIRGKGIGAKIGFPTINLKIEDDNIILPASGVYISKIKHNKKNYYGMTYIGINNLRKKFVIEMNIFNFKEKLYNKKILIFLIKKLRKDLKFIKLSVLKEQLLLDKQKAMQVVSRIKA